VYERAGYQLEGRLRDHWHRPTLGRNVDVMLYGLLRRDWGRDWSRDWDSDQSGQ
jgi:RimJ/RimL family protein N-acetyltransferase